MTNALKGHVLLVDDEPHVVKAHARVLSHAGFEVSTAADVGEARAKISAGTCDAVVSDVELPGESGIDLLRWTRAHDPDLPIVLVTGKATIGTAAQAVEHGALRYLLKPVDAEALVDIVRRAATLRRWTHLRRQATAEAAASDLHVLSGHLDDALASLFIAWQPIVSWSGKRVVAYEALMRTKSTALPHPGAILEAAERTARVAEVGRTVRVAVARSAHDLPSDVGIFVNMHPHELNDPSLYASTDPLAAFSGRVVFEVTERTALDEIGDVAARVATLRTLGHGIALDDIGAGYAGLSSFARLSPDVVKIDMSLVRDVNRLPLKRKLVASVMALGADLGLKVVAEGVETAGERDTLLELGGDLLQGYLFGRPSEVIRDIAF